MRIGRTGHSLRLPNIALERRFQEVIGYSEVGPAEAIDRFVQTEELTLCSTFEQTDRPDDGQMSLHSRLATVEIVHQQDIGLDLNGQADRSLFARVDERDRMDRTWSPHLKPLWRRSDEVSDDRWGPQVREFTGDLRWDDHASEKLGENLDVANYD